MAEIQDMAQDIIQEYVNKVRMQFLTEDEEGASSWLPHCESHIRCVCVCMYVCMYVCMHMQECVIFVVRLCERAMLCYAL